jgi:hypothetical protein
METYQVKALAVDYEPMWNVQLKEKLGIELLVKFL